MRKKSLILYVDYLDCMESLSMRARGELVTAVLMHQKGEEVPRLSRVVKPIFRMISAQVDRDSEAYRRRCEENRRNARKRWGQMDDATECDRMRTDADNDNDNDTDTDTDTGSETESESDTDTAAAAAADEIRPDFSAGTHTPAHAQKRNSSRQSRSRTEGTPAQAGQDNSRAPSLVHTAMQEGGERYDRDNKSKDSTPTRKRSAQPAAPGKQPSRAAEGMPEQCAETDAGTMTPAHRSVSGTEESPGLSCEGHPAAAGRAVQNREADPDTVKITEGPAERKRRLQQLRKKSFARFWERYPVKLSRPRAWRAFEELDPDEGLCERIMQGLERALARDFRFRVDRYTPQAATWLADRGWEDDYPPLPSLKSADSTQRGGTSGTAGTEATRERLGNFDTWDFFRNALARSERAFRAGTDAQGNR